MRVVGDSVHRGIDPRLFRILPALLDSGEPTLFRAVKKSRGARRQTGCQVATIRRHAMTDQSLPEIYRACKRTESGVIVSTPRNSPPKGRTASVHPFSLPPFHFLSFAPAAKFTRPLINAPVETSRSLTPNKSAAEREGGSLAVSRYALSPSRYQSRPV